MYKLRVHRLAEQGTSLALTEHPERGVGIQATGSIDAGTLLLRERPLAVVQTVASRADGVVACDHCLSPHVCSLSEQAQSMLAARGVSISVPDFLLAEPKGKVRAPWCSLCVYCSELCRSQAGELYPGLRAACSTGSAGSCADSAWHRYEREADECSNDYYLLLAKVFAMIAADPSVGEAFTELRGRPWWELMEAPHEPERPRFVQAIQEQTKQVAAELQGLLPSLPGGCFSVQGFGEAVGRLRMNCQAVKISNPLKQYFEQLVCEAPQKRLEAVEALTPCLQAFIRRFEAQGAQAQACDEPEALDRVFAPVGGIGIFALESAINHSCEPNARVCFDQESQEAAIRVDSIRHIGSGQEVTISYLGDEVESMSREERRARLNEQYAFWCECTRCMSGS